MRQSATFTRSATCRVHGALTLLTDTAPASNDLVTIGFQQPIGATAPLRTGAYGNTLTLSLATSTP